MARVVVEVPDELHLALKRRALEEGGSVAELVRPVLEALGSGQGGGPAMGPVPSSPDFVGDAGVREAPAGDRASASVAAPSPSFVGGAAGDEPVSPPICSPGESADREAAAGAPPVVALPAGFSCDHPKGAERKYTWGVVCGDCSMRVR